MIDQLQTSRSGVSLVLVLEHLRGVESSSQQRLKLLPHVSKINHTQAAMVSSEY
jgi:hypothetical protein